MALPRSIRSSPSKSSRLKSLPIVSNSPMSFSPLFSLSLCKTPIRASTSTFDRSSNLNFRSFSRSIARPMPSSNSSALNRSGLTPEESKKLSTREPTSKEQSIVKSIKELYSCSPTNSTYDIYTENAVFHDPIGYAEGKQLIASQFNSLPKLFEKSTIDRFTLLQNPPSLPSSTILIDQDVTYYRKASSPTKTVNSLLTLERDTSGKVVRHTEEWDHKKETDGSHGFFGMLNEARKTLTAKLTGASVTSDASKI